MGFNDFVLVSIEIRPKVIYSNLTICVLNLSVFDN